MKRSVLAPTFALLMFSSVVSRSQSSSTDQLQIAPAVIQETNNIDAGATSAELEKKGDELRAAKLFADAFDFYSAAISKNPRSAVLYNKLGICELLRQRYRSANAYFQRAIKLDRHYASAYNNVGVLEYAVRKYGKAIQQYEKAIALEPGGASYYSNLGAAYFAKKSWEKATQAYSKAVSLDPDIFQETNRAGVTGQIASPADRAHFSFVLAKLYARSGMNDRSLECLRRAMEEGYKGVNAVYSDADFHSLRQDPRFTQLMAARPVSIPE